MIVNTGMLYVYILKCADGSYYTGVTNSIERRFAEHQSGINNACYTYTRLPVELVFIEQFQRYDQAIAFEKQIKGWSRKKKEALIEKNYALLKELAVCKNNTSHTNHVTDTTK